MIYVKLVCLEKCIPNMYYEVQICDNTLMLNHGSIKLSGSSVDPTSNIFHLRCLAQSKFTLIDLKHGTYIQNCVWRPTILSFSVFFAITEINEEIESMGFVVE